MERRSTPLRFLLVDVGGVLFDEKSWPTRVDPDFRSVQLQRLRNAFPDERPWFDHLFADGYPDAEPPLWQQNTRGFIAAVLQEHGEVLGLGDFERICAAHSLPLTGYGSPEPGAAKALQIARDLGIKLAICSNTIVRTSADYRRDFAEFGLDQFFDAYVTSLEVGFAKPHPAIFESALALLGCHDPHEAAMIGDRLDRDIIGARALEMRTIWVRPSGTTETPDPVPDAEIHSLHELPAILRAWAAP